MPLGVWTSIFKIYGKNEELGNDTVWQNENIPVTSTVGSVSITARTRSNTIVNESTSLTLTF
jgi:hypothetical protein